MLLGCLNLYSGTLYYLFKCSTTTTVLLLFLTCYITNSWTELHGMQSGSKCIRDAEMRYDASKYRHRPLDGISLTVFLVTFSTCGYLNHKIIFSQPPESIKDRVVLFLFITHPDSITLLNHSQYDANCTSRSL